MKLKAIDGIDLVRLAAKRDAVTTSRMLAEKFGKRHKNVLQKIDALKDRSPDVFTELKIQPSTYTDDSGKRNKEYLLNRDAFLWFAMSFTGKRADKFRADFIKAFNAMEEWIKTRLKNSLEYQVMSETLHEVRQLHGKETKAHHYSNEARLINWALTGKFTSLDRASLSADELDLLLDLQKRNSVLIGAGMPYQDRKESLRIFCDLRKSSQSPRAGAKEVA